MNEKIYKTMSRAGICSLVTGIVILVNAIAVGTILIVNGAKLIKRKYEITI